MSTHRIQRMRTKGWRMPAGAVNCTRPTIWGNPFVHPDPAEAVAAYRRLVEGRGMQSFHIEPGGLQFARRFHPNCLHHEYGAFVRENAPKLLRGRALLCWCAAAAPCHADVLIEIANRG